MEVKSLSHANLLTATLRLVEEERQTTSTILYHFQEIEKRRLHLERGFASMHEFAVKFLKYSDGAAHRRIAASRLLTELPAVRDQIESGVLSLSVVAQAQNFFRSEKIHDAKEKAEVLEKLENKSLRQAQQELLKISPEALPKERERALTSELTELKIVINEELKKKITHLKNLLSHRKQNMSHADLLEIMVDMVTAQVEKGPRKASVKKLETKRGRRHCRAPSVQLKYEVRIRDENQCTYTDPETGRRCMSQYRLEFDHRVPFAMGGKTEAENLRLLCRAHNGLHAVHEFGGDKMRAFQKQKSLRIRPVVVPRLPI